MNLKKKNVNMGSISGVAGNSNGGSKKKYFIILNNFFKNLTYLTNHLENLFKNKYINQEFYIEKMYALSDLNNKISILEKSLNKKNNKKFLEGFILDIDDLVKDRVGMTLLLQCSIRFINHCHKRLLCKSGISPINRLRGNISSTNYFLSKNEL